MRNSDNVTITHTPKTKPTLQADVGNSDNVTITDTPQAKKLSLQARPQAG